MEAKVTAPSTRSGNHVTRCALRTRSASSHCLRLITFDEHLTHAAGRPPLPENLKERDRAVALLPGLALVVVVSGRALGLEGVQVRRLLADRGDPRRRGGRLDVLGAAGQRRLAPLRRRHARRHPHCHRLDAAAAGRPASLTCLESITTASRCTWAPSTPASPAGLPRARSRSASPRRTARPDR